MSDKIEPVWVESLLSLGEWKECSRIYPNTYNMRVPPIEFEGPYKWRKGMGRNLSEGEIEIINKRLDAVLKKAGIVR